MQGVLEAEPLIDLGELGGELDEVWAVPAGGALRSRPRVLVALLVGCLVGLTAASAAPPDRTHPLWTIQSGEGTSVLASGDVVYLVEHDTPAALTAIDASTSRPWWRLALRSAPLAVMDLGAGFDAVVLRAAPTPADSGIGIGGNGAAGSASGPVAGSGPDETWLVVRGSGRVLARVAGDPVRRFGALVLLDVHGRTCAECGEVDAVDLATGQIAWRLLMGQGGRLLAHGEATGGLFATASADGSISLHTVATAAELTTVAGTVTSGGGIRLSASAAGVLVVGRADVEHTALTGYRVDTLDRLWTLDLPRDPGPRQPEAALVGLRPCGDLICVADGGGTAVVDAGTGRLRFRTPLTALTRVGTGALLAEPYLGHLDASGRFARDIAALDPHTGRVVATVANADLVDAGSPGNEPGATVSAAQAVLRRVTDRQTDFTVFAGDGRATQLFTVARDDLICARGGAVLACVDDAGAVRAWRVPG